MNEPRDYALQRVMEFAKNKGKDYRIMSEDARERGQYIDSGIWAARAHNFELIQNEMEERLSNEETV